jgi:N-acetylglucosamine kinase-like BadF-type ATPase
MGQHNGVTADDRTPVILGIDGGNSKVDVAVVDARGNLLGAVRGPTISHQAVGLEAGMSRLAELVASLGQQADLAVATVAGADYPEDVELLERAMGALSFAPEVIVLNDTFGALRAGTSRGWGVGLVCGQGINAGAIAPDGTQDRFPGVGDYAGDWGGGGGVAQAAISAAVRGDDGRGPRTALEQEVPQFFGVDSPAQLTREFYFERIPESRVSSLAPTVFRVAAGGDRVAREIIDRLADELSTMAAILIRRLGMQELDVQVVLAGGVFRNEVAPFYDRLETGIRRAAPRALTVKLNAPPVAGALLLGLDELARRGVCAAPDAQVGDSIRDALRAWDSAQR